MREETDAIRTHYNADPRKEWDRLMKKHPHEKYITIHIMDRYIQPGCSILDIGGGAGSLLHPLCKTGASGDPAGPER